MSVNVYRTGCETTYRRADTQEMVPEYLVRDCDARGCHGPDHRQERAGRCSTCDGDGLLLLTCPFNALADADISRAVINELATQAARGNWKVLEVELRTLVRAVTAKFVSFLRHDGVIEDERKQGLQEYARQWLSDSGLPVPGPMPFGIVEGEGKVA